MSVNTSANRRASTASGVPDHLQTDAIQGLGAPAGPVAPWAQTPPSFSGVGIVGVELPIDPMLAFAGAFWNDRRQLVRKVILKAGAPELIDGRWRQAIESDERLVAPPGMSLPQARDNGLDFFSPSDGWIRAGVKREREYPENLGVSLDRTEYVDVGAPDASEGV